MLVYLDTRVLDRTAAIVGGCEAFLTNDQRLAACPDISVMLLSAP
jgi:hypothetical protein